MWVFETVGHRWLALAPAIAGALVLAFPGRLDATDREPEASFLAENQVAMEKMMAGMKAKSSGVVDRDFATQMIAHHQGAIDMARAELRYGHDESLRRLAQGIIIEQQQEIDVMRSALQHIS